MTARWTGLMVLALLVLGDRVSAAESSGDGDKPAATVAHFKADEKDSQGSVTIGGTRVDYHAVAGTLVVHPANWDDVPGTTSKEPASRTDETGDDEHNPTAEASMFYVAYFGNSPKGQNRPVTFLYNGGPGSASTWVHMGAFGPKRVVTPDDNHVPAAPYALINNDSSLLDASDLVFIDAPGTGFSRIAGKDKEKAFYGVDQDAYAFAEFITQFLTKYGRWNSPKYLFGESYGTTRSAVLANLLETDRSVDLNGVILLSQVLSFTNGVDEPELNPGVDLPYELALPTYAATAWYHHKLSPERKQLVPLLDEVEQFALNDYALALNQGAALPASQRDAMAAKLHDYTGLPVAYILRANLRIDGGEFEKTLQDDSDITTGRLDTRFSGPTMDPLEKEASYDPQSAAVDSAYVSTFNDYVRKDLKYDGERAFKPGIDVPNWDFHHKPPGAHDPAQIAVNVMPDLASALKFNPNLKVQMNAGYFDLATPFFAGIFELRHLPMPSRLQANIDYKFYESGHMVYALPSALKQLHDNVADFVRRTDNLPPG